MAHDIREAAPPDLLLLRIECQDSTDIAGVSGSLHSQRNAEVVDVEKNDKLDEDVVARLMPYREIDYPDGDLPVAPLTRACPGGLLTPLHLLSALARAHPDVAGERVQQCRAEAEAVAEQYMALLEDADIAWEPDPEDAIELEAE